jgi:hypothetical protein
VVTSGLPHEFEQRNAPACDKSQFPEPATAFNVERGDNAVVAMKALILYVVFVTIGGVISTGIGYFVEKEFSSTASLIVFLALFFSNFAVSWIAVILAIDGSLKNAQGAQEQLDIEKAGRAGIASRESNAIAARAAKIVAAAPKARPAG